MVVACLLMSRAWQLRNQLFDIHGARHFRSILVQNFSIHLKDSDMSSLNVRRQCALYCRVRYPRLQTWWSQVRVVEITFLLTAFNSYPQTSHWLVGILMN